MPGIVQKLSIGFLHVQDPGEKGFHSLGCFSQGSRETGYTQKKAEAYLAEDIGIRARQTEVTIDRDEDDTAVIEGVVPDGVGNLCRVISNDRLVKVVRVSFAELPWTA